MAVNITSMMFFGFIAELNPVERFDAARQLSGSDSAEHWFILLGYTAAAVLVILFILVTVYRKRYENKVSKNIFSEYAGKRGLSAAQERLLATLAGKANLKKPEAIFNLPTVFERITSQVIAEAVSTKSPQEASSLRKNIFEIRRKLGFQAYQAKSNKLQVKSSKLSSRQLPEGKEIILTSLQNSSISNITAKVVENTDMELKVKPSVLIDTSPARRWRINYNFGAAVWEFDTTVLSVDSESIAFNHSSEVRYINRRRFFRTKVNKPALIADFPFSRKLKKETSGENDTDTEQPNAKMDYMNPPKFVSGVVTELAGPGLLIETDIDIEVGQRILVVFELNKSKRDEGSKENTDNDSGTLLIEDVGMVEEVGQVRRKTENKNHRIIAVELTGLSDSEVDELVRATNNAAVLSAKQAKENQKKIEKLTITESG